MAAAILSRMRAKSAVPMALRQGPFTVREAHALGISRDRLRSASFRRLGAGLYRWAGLKEGPLVILGAMAKRIPADAAFSGHTAAWLHGLDVAPYDPIEVTIPGPTSGHRARALVRRAGLDRSQIVMRRGLPTTSALRTAADLGGRDPITEGVVAADAFLHAELVTIEELCVFIAEHPHAKGIARLRRVVDLAEPRSESAMETRLRMLLVLAGLPRPEAQASLLDDRGRFVARTDLFYRAQRLAIEYDGGNHRDRLVADNRRQNRIIEAGYRLLRFTAADVYVMPDLVALRVRDCLRHPPVRTSHQALYRLAPSDAAEWPGASSS